VFVAEIGDITRFARAAQLASWAGLTPKHHESDTTVHRGRITKQGSTLVRWAAVEAVQRVGAHTRLGQVRDRVGERRGRSIGVVAAARELIVLVFYGLRDHHIRCLSARTEADQALINCAISARSLSPARMCRARITWLAATTSRSQSVGPAVP
jgi:uncharacterized DUF497 family protein